MTSRGAVVLGVGARLPGGRSPKDLLQAAPALGPLPDERFPAAMMAQTLPELRGRPLQGGVVEDFGVDWEALKQDLIADDFHNGRTTDQLRLSFENSAQVVMAWDGDQLVGNARQLSDGVGNAYVIDVWTRTDHRHQGIGSEMMRQLMAAVPGQHIYLQTDAVEFYEQLGFREQPVGMSAISGDYLDNDTRR